MKNSVIKMTGSFVLLTTLLLFLPGCPIDSQYYHESLAKATRSQMVTKEKNPDIIVYGNKSIVSELLRVIAKVQGFERIEEFDSSIIDSLARSDLLKPSDDLIVFSQKIPDNALFEWYHIILVRSNIEGTELFLIKHSFFEPKSGDTGLYDFDWINAIKTACESHSIGTGTKKR